MNPAIVISAYNRPNSLARLLASLAKADYAVKDVPLVISIDRGHLGDRGDDNRNTEVRAVAEAFEWQSGAKRVIQHADHLGLVAHFFYCGGLTQEYGSVIFLEDDLLVSPDFFKYATQALSFYDNDARIAGISLYALWFNGYTKQPFVPLSDDADAFFIQAPYTQGQAWTHAQWTRFADWRASGNRALSRDDNIHEMFLHFDAEDWFPLLTKFIIETDRYYAYPRVSLTTGAGDTGTHFKRATSFFQVPLQRSKDCFKFKPLDDSFAVYDSFFEIRPDRLNRLTDALRDFEYDVDLYATKEPRHLSAPYVLTSRRCRSPILSFGKTMWPIEANVIEAVPGAEIVLSRKENVRRDWLAELETKKSNHEYFTRHQKLSKKTSVQYALLDLIRRR